MRNIILSAARLTGAIPALSLLCLGQTTYTYDPGGRLTRITYGASNSIVYGYDSAGHLISRAIVNGAGGTIASVTTGFTPVSSGIAPDAWVEIKGTNLVSGSTPAAGVIWGNAPEFALGQMPTTLGGVSVSINGKPAYVYFYCSAATSPICSQDQINVLTPPDLAPGNVPVVVFNNGLATAPFTVAVHPLVPSLFTFDGTHIVATHLNYTLIGPTSLYPGLSTPASPGEIVIVYASGFGIPSGTTITGGAASQSGRYSPPPACTIGGSNAAVGFAGLVGPGLVQLNVTVPVTASAGDLPMTCTYGGVASPAGRVLTVK